MYAKSILKAMLGETVNGVIPVELMPTHRIMERWSVVTGTGLPTAMWDDRKQSRPPPLDDDSALVIDRIVIRLPTKTRRIVEGWYCRPIPTRELASELGMAQRSLEKAHHLSLNFLKWKMEGTNHRTLLKLLRVQV